MTSTLVKSIITVTISHTHTRLTAIFLGFTVFTMCCVLVVWTGAAGRAGEASDLHLARSLFMSVLCELHCTILQMHCVCVCVRACVRACARGCVVLFVRTGYTHTQPFNGLFSGTGAGTRKVKPIWILLKQETVSGSGISWAICKSAPHSTQTTTPAPHHSVFLQAGCPSCRPTNSVKALKAVVVRTGYLLKY